MPPETKSSTTTPDEADTGPTGKQTPPAIMAAKGNAPDKDPRGATPHHLSPDVWPQIGGKWVLFGHGQRETESCYMGVF